MRHKKIIVGSNSRLVRLISPYLSGFDFISHKDVGVVDLDKYEFVFLFSWDARSLEGNITLARSVGLPRVVFISTTAVYALQFRDQWNIYPVHKKILEDLVLQAGGGVIRVGVVFDEVSDRMQGAYPYTSPENLATVLNQWQSERRPVECWTIRRNSSTAMFERIYVRCFGWMASTLPSRLLFQLPLLMVARLWGVVTKGYTQEANRYFRCEIMIGCGALGARYQSVRPDKSRLVLVSPEPHHELNSWGFNRTLLGRAHFGLGSLWHGVYMTKGNTPGKAVKHVPIFPERPSLARDQMEEVTVQTIKWERAAGNWFVEARMSSGRNAVYFCKRLVLAAGALENTRLLLGAINTDKTVHLSDHELICLGNVSLESAVQCGLVLRWGPFVFYKNSIYHEGTKAPFLYEARPLVRAKLNESIGADFYLAGTARIIYRLMSSLSPSRLNEAIYNKIGVAVATPRLMIFVQALSKGGIILDKKNGAYRMRRQRISLEEWAEVLAQVRVDGLDLEPAPHQKSVDAQHILGGGELLSEPLIAELVACGALEILGSPSTDVLGPFHHTHQLRERIGT